ncbi:hypothetical protein SKAU_G00308150 [Synaphobranchus kaupii]|uniref:Uncharacterized protein n=1 Tax=Synaphobranchus kaupii TaxID=118154 RepID=A0A9Q1ER03_SYNKA|nr:hypothetical protein SKAU_G00308150 [Synaphobranchus kaupii]
MNLNPVRFQTASFELMHPGSENTSVTVSRDSGDIVIARRLDRETEPVVEITVKVQGKRGHQPPTLGSASPRLQSVSSLTAVRVKRILTHEKVDKR